MSIIKDIQIGSPNYQEININSNKYLNILLNIQQLDLLFVRQNRELDLFCLNFWLIFLYL